MAVFMPHTEEHTYSVGNVALPIFLSRLLCNYVCMTIYIYIYILSVFTAI